MAKTSSFFRRAALAAVATMALASCESFIYDDLNPCESRYFVNFIYDYNMKYADAFNHEVEGVTLYVADAATDRILKVYDDRGDHLKEKGYAMHLEGLQPGNYKLMAWCGMHRPTTFKIPQGETLQHLTATMERHYDDYQRAHRYDDIDRLYYGKVIEIEIPETTAENEGDHFIEMPLIKDTNNIRVTIQQLSGEEMDKDKYEVLIVDANGAMNWDNSMLREDEDITYHAWQIRSASAEIFDDMPSDSRAAYNAVAAELTVPRLMSHHDKSSRLIIKNSESGETIASIALIDALLLTKGHYNRDMSDQEFLDRKDEYTLTFFLDKGDRWINQYIYIESWRVVLSNAEL